MFLAATARGTRAEIRKQLDEPIAGSTYRQLATAALSGRDPLGETDAIMAAMFGSLIALNVASAAVVVLNTMLLLVEQRRPLIGRSRALGATRAEIEGRFQVLAGLTCALPVLPAYLLVGLASAALNQVEVLHMVLNPRPELAMLGFGTLSAPAGHGTSMGAAVVGAEVLSSRWTA